MRQTLFYIPHELYGVEVFGLGWALAAWIAFGIGILIFVVRRAGGWAEAQTYLPVLAVVGVAIYALLPALEVRAPGMPPLGLPVRGYGLFVLLGVVAGVGLSVYRARQVGLDPDVIFSLAFWLFVLGILGARLFFVIQNWHEFVQANVVSTLIAITKFTEGGLVVYGSVFGGLLALFLFAWKHRLSMFELGDVIAPGMALGLAFGRIGCLMNGCCYGGMCESWPLGIQFPKYASTQLQNYSPPYAHQLAMGRLHGFHLGTDAAEHPIVVNVEAGSAAERAGLRTDMTIRAINGEPVEKLHDAQRALLRSGPDLQLGTDDGQTIAWSIGSLPELSRRVHPTQIYASINAALLCLVVWFAFPYRRHHGEILLLLFGLYAITRFLEEAIRDDEVGQWGTPFTISQLVSLAMLVIIIPTWLYLRRQPVITNP